MSLAPALVLSKGDRERLAELASLPDVSQGLAKRAQMVLLAADGMPNAQIARMVGVSRPTVICWRDRYQRGGIEALGDEPRSGRPPRIDEVDVVVATLASGGKPPQRLGIPHWSARFLAAELGISFASVARIWRRWGIQPHRIETFTFSTDPGLEPRIGDVVGLYLNPPANAVVVTTGEESETGEVDWAGLVPAPRPGQAQDRAHGHMHHGTGTLFAALEVATGKVTANAWYPRHKEFLGFLKMVASAHPGELRVVLDNDGTPDHPEVRRWLAKRENQRISLHFTPAMCSWLNMVEIFFGIVPHQATRRGLDAAGEPGHSHSSGSQHSVGIRFRSVKELTATIGGFTEAYGDRCQPFTWAKELRP